MAREVTRVDEARQLAAVRADLVREFSRLEAAEVERRFDEIVHAFDEVSIRTYVPVLVCRRARTELRRLLPPA